MYRRFSSHSSGVEKINGTMGSRDCFSKVLPNIKLATRFDADGKEVQVIPFQTVQIRIARKHIEQCYFHSSD